MSIPQKIWFPLLAITATVIAVLVSHSDPPESLSSYHLKVESLETEKSTLLTRVEELVQERRNLELKLTALQAQNPAAQQALAAQIPAPQGATSKQYSSRTGTSEKTASSDGETPFAKAVSALASRAGDLNQQFQTMPDKEIPELQYLDEGDWLHLAKAANLDSPEGVRKALADVRQQAKARFAPLLTTALAGFYNDNNAQPPISMAQLKPYFSVPVDDATLARYNIVTDPSGKQKLGSSTYISEGPPVDTVLDSHFEIGLTGWSSNSINQSYTEKNR
ncbi:MAG: hypothetical protein DVB28_000248 [Verrucomicrobia bacterium]|nr:MAG: hypothetical protein DVB28_000248 [Verrucomicrobiota bacterium]